MSNPEVSRKSSNGNRSLWAHARVLGALAALTAALALPGCVSVEAELAEVVVTHQALELDGSHLPIDVGEAAITTSFEHPRDSISIPPEVDSELRPTGATLIAGEGIDDLSFLTSFTVIIATTAPNGPPPAVVFEYQRPENGEVGTAISVSPAARPNVMEYWQTGAAYYELSVAGDLPERLWTVDIAVEFSGKVQVEI